MNMGVARIIGDMTGTDTLTFNLYADGALKKTKSITSLDTLFKLPKGYRAKEYFIEVTGTGSGLAIDRIEVGTSVYALRGLG